jgi:hypothetical protein
METQSNKEQSREERIQAYAEALDFFIEKPETLNDSALRLLIDFFKEKVAQEQERHVKGIGMQKQLIKT